MNKIVDILIVHLARHQIVTLIDFQAAISAEKRK